MQIQTQNRSESGRCARVVLCPHPTRTDTGDVAAVPGGTEENHRTSISIAGIWAEN
jgi:hypothetical protein